MRRCMLIIVCCSESFTCEPQSPLSTCLAPRSLLMRSALTLGPQNWFNVFQVAASKSDGNACDRR